MVYLLHVRTIRRKSPVTSHAILHHHSVFREWGGGAEGYLDMMDEWMTCILGPLQQYFSHIRTMDG